MRRDSLRLLLLIGVVGFAVLYGMELSSSGISRVYGPLEEPSAVQESPEVSEDEEWTLPPARTVPPGYMPDGPYAFPRDDRVPLVDRLSAATAETLHHISSGGIRLVVSLFDKVTGS